MRMIVEPQPVKSFREWLSEQPLERQREIRSAERAYRDKHRRAFDLDARGIRNDPVEQAYLDSMEGWEDPPAGIRNRAGESISHEPILSLSSAASPANEEA